MSRPKVCAVVLAAGSSQRYGSDKLESPLGHLTVWETAVNAFRHSPWIDAFGLVTSAEKVDLRREQCADALFIVPGGSTRVESSLAGLRAVPQEFDIVLVHDAARPWVTDAVIQRVVKGVIDHRAAYAAIPVTDTVRQGATLLDRQTLSAAQTPQGGFRADLLAALEEAVGSETDDIAVLQRAGIEAVAVPGDPANKKVTYADDLSTLTPAIPETRTGFGYDIHAFSSDPDRPMWLGCIEFDDRPGLDGHSDADALTHAVVDALLGAIGAGDIGDHFPNTDPRWKDCPSRRFLEEAAAHLRDQGWQIVNLDATVVAERPKLAPQREAVRQALADAMGITLDRVSVKATTNEKLGAIGRSEGVAAMAVATVIRTKSSP